MNNEPLYLRQNVLVEPLFNQWYAWPYLIPPATAAMFIANMHLKIMQSFVAAPQIHVAALKNPAMRGGPFINYGADKAPAVKALVEQTTRDSAPLLELAAAVQRANAALAADASGFSLEPLYEKIPEALRGYVELVYDLNNAPSLRFIEGLLYKSPYYTEAPQAVALSLVEGDERPFALSTPYLRDDSKLHLHLPFRSAALDELFRMKTVPQTLGHIKEALGVSEADGELFATFFTSEPPPPPPRYDGDAVRVRYFGHACILVESKETSILFDPVISYKYDNGIERYTYADLPETIDYVVITHGHQDHFMFESLLQLRHKTRHVVVPRSNGGGLADPSLRLILQQAGFRNVIELDEMGSVEVEGGEIVGLPFMGEHADLNIRAKLAYLVNLKGRKVMCAADSNNIEPRLYQHIHDAVGDVDVLFLGMECDGGPLTWLYGPLMTSPLARKMDQSRRLDGSDHAKGMDIVNRLNAKQVYIYAMGQEPWLTFLTSIQYTPESRPIVESDRVVTDCSGRGLSSERLFGRKEILLRPADDEREACEARTACAVI
ncbi:MAG TPA: MBL fold metallo-hydrolase [Pyrinomonadaceae bacterium]|jgi:L-ascorbate metabolism protein UlaG (beta-lactamase superfamily)